MCIWILCMYRWSCIPWVSRGRCILACFWYGFFSNNEVCDELENRGYYLACLFYRYWWNFHIKHNLFFVFIFEKMQLKSSPIAKWLSQICFETRILSCNGEIKTILRKFSVPKSQNYNEEEKNHITAKAYFEKAILWMKLEKKRRCAWAARSLVIGLSYHVSNHGNTNIPTRERYK